MLGPAQVVGFGVAVTPFLAALALGLLVFVGLLWRANAGNPAVVVLYGQDEHAVMGVGVFLMALWYFDAFAIAGLDVTGWVAGLGAVVFAWGAIARWTDWANISFLFN